MEPCKESMLNQWPIQLRLVPPTASFLRNADLLLTGDCVPFSYPDFHQSMLRGHVVLVACPKLDDFEAHLQKLIDILKQAKPKTITVVHMEVPCCSGLVRMAARAIAGSSSDIPLGEIIVGTKGDIL